MRYTDRMRLKWTEANAVFLPEIDAEHRHLFQIAESLEAAIRGNSGTARILESMRALTAGAEDHFAHEERQMHSTHYPSLAWHKHQHDTFRKRMQEFSQRIEDGDSEAAFLVLEFLSGWLKDHTAVTDRMLGAHLRNHERAERESANRNTSPARQTRLAT